MLVLVLTLVPVLRSMKSENKSFIVDAINNGGDGAVSILLSMSSSASAVWWRWMAAAASMVVLGVGDFFMCGLWSAGGRLHWRAILC